MDNVIEKLNIQARHANKSGYYTQRDVMLIAAREIEKLKDELNTTAAAYEFVCEFCSDRLKELDDR